VAQETYVDVKETYVDAKETFVEGNETYIDIKRLVTRQQRYGVATISRLLKMIGLYYKRAL